MTLWMTFATWPSRRELSSLTRSSKHVQRTAREAASRIRPTVRSDISVDANKCLPTERVTITISLHFCHEQDTSQDTVQNANKAECNSLIKITTLF